MTTEPKQKRRVHGRQLDEYLNELVADRVVPSRAAIARHLRMTPQGLARAASGKYGRTLTAEQCLTLARLAFAEPADICRMAKRDGIADLLEELCQPDENFSVSRREKEFFKQWRQLTGLEKHHVAEIVRLFCAERARADTIAGPAETLPAG